MLLLVLNSMPHKKTKNVNNNMQSITLISGTNRIDSYTEKVANYYQTQLKLRGVESSILSLKNLPEAFISSDLYGKRSNEFQTLIDSHIANETNFIFLVPEYNGSFAGILKVFLDAIPPKLWLDKKACLVGISSGRAGNVIGLEHLTTILNHLKIHIYHHKLPISRVDTLIDESGNLTDLETQKIIAYQLDGFSRF